MPQPPATIPAVTISSGITHLRTYSMTKPITSVALMMLCEQGHFQLGDRVSKFIPEWKDLQVYVSREYPDFVTRPPEKGQRLGSMTSLYALHSCERLTAKPRK